VTKPDRHIPRHMRRLTREEAALRGVSFSAKRQVRADIKRITKRTKLYTDREVGTAKIRRITGNRQATRESHALERKARATTEKLIVIQPGGTCVDVAVQGSDITKIRERNIAMAEARAKDDGSRNLAPLNRFMRRYKRHYVTDCRDGRADRFDHVA